MRFLSVLYLFFEMVSVTEPKAHQFSEAGRPPLSLPSAGTKDEHCHLSFPVATGDLNSGLHSCITSTLPTEPSPQFLTDLSHVPPRSEHSGLECECSLHLEVDDTKIQAGSEVPEESLVLAAMVDRRKAYAQGHPCPHIQKL